jgi:hypothetical protein
MLSRNDRPSRHQFDPVGRGYGADAEAAAVSAGGIRKGKRNGLEKNFEKYSSWSVNSHAAWQGCCRER